MNNFFNRAMATTALSSATLLGLSPTMQAQQNVGTPNVEGTGALIIRGGEQRDESGAAITPLGQMGAYWEVAQGMSVKVAASIRPYSGNKDADILGYDAFIGDEVFAINSANFGKRLGDFRVAAGIDTQVANIIYGRDPFEARPSALPFNWGTMKGFDPISPTVRDQVIAGAHVTYDNDIHHAILSAGLAVDGDSLTSEPAAALTLGTRANNDRVSANVAVRNDEHPRPGADVGHIISADIGWIHEYKNGATIGASVFTNMIHGNNPTVRGVEVAGSIPLYENIRGTLVALAVDHDERPTSGMVNLTAAMEWAFAKNASAKVFVTNGFGAREDARYNAGGGVGVTVGL